MVDPYGYESWLRQQRFLERQRRRQQRRAQLRGWSSWLLFVLGSCALYGVMRFLLGT